MSTNDVPGANPVNRDELSMGCWAEHTDGSLILVEGNENHQVVYSIFDTSKDPVVEYRDAMDEKGFKSKFSWDPKSQDSIKWTWHDKTSFPWKRVMKDFDDGPRYASGRDFLSVAARVAESMGLKGKNVDSKDVEHRTDKLSPKQTKILKKIQENIAKLGI